MKDFILNKSGVGLEITVPNACPHQAKSRGASCKNEIGIIELLKTMKLFTSKYEKCLWLWTLAVLLAIYSTLGIVQPVGSFLREKGLLSALFIFGLLLVIATLIILGLKKPVKFELSKGEEITRVPVYSIVNNQIKWRQSRCWRLVVVE